jgi:unsaturated rhamnogalacturonyl hydrolase
MTDPVTGLLYHAWDDSSEVDWADKRTGLSSQFWGRAIGWYAVAHLEILDCLPAGHPYRSELINAERDLVNALIRYQDDSGGAGDGLWYQVVDRGDDPRNWHETSCSCLFLYAIAKSVRTGILDKSYARYADKAWAGVARTVKVEGDSLTVPKVCVGTCVGDYDFYLARPTVENDLHGMGAFLLAATEYHRMKKG